MSAAKSIKLYTSTTPNGYKITILLELLGLKYDVHPIELSKGEQKEDWFLKLNPNGRVPTLVDNSKGVTMSESGAIMLYLVDNYDKERKYSYERDTKEYYHQLETLFFQMAGIGPMQGQAAHFIKFAPEKIDYGIKRYTDESKRLYFVVDEYLRRNETNGPYLVGNHLSISDIAVYTWVRFATSVIDFNQYKFIPKWIDNISKMPEVQKGLSVPKAIFPTE